VQRDTFACRRSISSSGYGIVQIAKNRSEFQIEALTLRHHQCLLHEYKHFAKPAVTGFFVGSEYAHPAAGGVWHSS
jgi:hypothetical protein